MTHSDCHVGQDVTYWEDVASTRWGAYITEINKGAILRAHDLVTEPAAALEIGSEGGRWSKLLTDLGWSMTCTDIDEETLAICQKRIPTAECILVKPDEKRLPCDSQSMSLLLCMEVAPVIQSDWFVGEADRVLRKDGLIVGVFWNLTSFRGLWAQFRGNRDFYQRSYPSWKRTFLRSGYSMLYEEGYCWLPFGRASNSVFVPYFVQFERWLGLRRLARFSPWIVFIAQKPS